jgi:hypothetical protein
MVQIKDKGGDKKTSKQVRVFFDLDGTLAGESEWRSVYWNTWRLFQTGLKFQIPEGMNWTLLCGRPRIDKPIIYWICKRYRLKPERIITLNKFKYHRYVTFSYVLDWKRQTMLKYLSDADKLLVYVDDDPKVRQLMDPHPKLFLCTTTSLESVLKRIQEDIL